MLNELLIVLNITNLQHTLPISLIKATTEKEYATTDKILIVHAALNHH